MKRKPSIVAPTTEDYPDPKEHIAATVAYHAGKGHLIPTADDGVPPWRDPEKGIEERLQLLAAAKPEYVRESLRNLGEAVGYSREHVRNSDWNKARKANPELVSRAAAKAIREGSQEYYEQFRANDE